MEFSPEQNMSQENAQAKPNTDDVELNEDQLEAVAGGAKGGFIVGWDEGDCTTQPVRPDSPQDEIYYK